MATLSKLVVKLGLDSSDLQSGFGKTRTQVDKFAKNVGGGLKKGLMIAGWCDGSRFWRCCRSCDYLHQAGC